MADQNRRNSVMKSASGVKKQRALGRSKPSRASLVSRGLAVNSTHVRCNDDDHSSPPSVQSGFSLYSSDSTDNTAVDVNRGLNRCAKLLANILDTDQGHSVEIGRATYKHQTQKLKTTNKARKSVSSAQESKVSQGNQKKLGQNVKTSSRTKKGNTKNHRRKDAQTTSMSVSAQAKHRGLERTESSRKGSTSVHVIPTGTNTSAERSGARLMTSVHKSNPRTKSHPPAPGFQDCLMSSTPEQRESPSKLSSAEQNETAKSLERNGKPEQSSVQRSPNRPRPKKRSVTPTKEDKLPHKLRDKSGEEIQKEAEQPSAFAQSSSSRVLESGRDYMQRYHQESVDDQTLREGHRDEESYSKLPTQKGEQKVRSLPTYQAMSNDENVRRTSSTAQHPSLDPVIDQSQECVKKVHPPLKNSQDLLRDLVQQLTVHNQSQKYSDVNTQDLLQGLIQDGGPVEVDRFAGRENEDMTSSTRRHVGKGQLHTDKQIFSKQDTLQDTDQNNDQPLSQLLSDFRQIHPLVSVGRQEETSQSVHPVLDPRNIDQGPYGRHTPEVLKHNGNLVSSKEMKSNEQSPHRVTFLTPTKDRHHDEIISGGSTPYMHQDGQRITPAGSDMPVGHGTSSPQRNSEPLLMDPRGTAIRQRTMQQIRILKYLIRELQAILADHGDLEVNRLLGELDETCNTLPYTTQKQLLDLNTEVLLAFQPLQSENSQLRRRLRIANHQLKRREMMEKEKTDGATVSLELLTIQALNANLQKQLQEERREKEKLLKSNHEISKRLDEKEQQHNDMLRIMDDKDTHLLKSRQDCLSELQELRSERTDLQSRVGFLELQVEGANKETKILQMSLDQRDKEITCLKNLTKSLHEQLRKLQCPGNEADTALKTLDGISLQRMNRLLMSRSPKADKENQRSRSDGQSFSSRPPKMYQQFNKKPSPNSKSDLNSPNYYAKFQKSPKKSPHRHVRFQRSTDDLVEKDVSGWARTDTLWKGQQMSTGDFTLSENRQHTLESQNETSMKTDKWLSSIPEDLDGTKLAGASKEEPVKGTYVSGREGESEQSEGKTLQDLYQRTDDDFILSMVGETNQPYVMSVQDNSHLVSEETFKPKSDFPSPVRPGPYKFPQGVLSKVETGSVVSDSTMSSVTSQYEAQFQMGLRNLDSEIGKLQASLKYSNFKSL